MGQLMRSCLQSGLKLVNSVIGIAGMGMLLYALWMLRVRARHVHGPESGPLWFIDTFLGLGISFCLITCSGHIAAETANGHCLSCYMVFVFLLVMLEAAITADVFLNSNWEEDFPDDPAGNFYEFVDFVRSNFETCKWIGVSVVAAQALSILLAIILRALGPYRESYYDSDDDSETARLPFLRNQSQRTPYAAASSSPKNDSWNVRILDKVNR